MKKTAIRILAWLGLVVVVLGACGWWVQQEYQQFLDTPLSVPESGYVLHIEPGTPAVAIIQQLDQQGVTEPGWAWKLLMRLEPPNVRAGEFQLKKGLRPQELLTLISGSAVVQYRFTVVEGWTFKQLLQALETDEVLEKTITDGDEESWRDVVGDSDIDHPEGWFLPETYLFTRSDADIDILHRSHQAMKNALAEAWRNRDEGLPLNSPYELLILASIIEKETALDSERREIAGVFIRRLNKRMRLQTDPTVIYGMGENYDGNIRRKDLRQDTPYNTYTRFGLPPTPIALPGRASLFATGQPADGEALYFVADGKGGHTFSKTLEEHQKAVNKLIGKG